MGDRDKPLELDDTATMQMRVRPVAVDDGERPPAPRRVGRFALGERLGEGGMGTVFRARDPDLDRTVAIKVLRADRFAGPTSSAARERLLREARAMAKLAHANVLTVYEVGTEGDAVFIVMELASGGTLRNATRR